MAAREDMGVFQLMSVSWPVFLYLLAFFKQCIEEQWSTMQRGSANDSGSGHKCLMSVSDVLGLTLVWIHVPCHHSMLMLVFGLCPSTLSVYLGCAVAGFQDCTSCAHRVAVTRGHDWLCIPDPELPGVFGFMDCLNLSI
jgi:hypothetical protein